MYIQRFNDIMPTVINNNNKTINEKNLFAVQNIYIIIYIILV